MLTVEPTSTNVPSGVALAALRFREDSSPVDINDIYRLFYFLDASSHLYKRVSPSVGPSVGTSVCTVDSRSNVFQGT